MTFNGDYITLYEDPKKFILWSMDKWINSSTNKYISSTSHAILRIEYMKVIFLSDSESGYILDALDYVYTDQDIVEKYNIYLNDNINFSSYFRQMMSVFL